MFGHNFTKNGGYNAKKVPAPVRRDWHERSGNGYDCLPDTITEGTGGRERDVSMRLKIRSGAEAGDMREQGRRRGP